LATNKATIYVVVGGSLGGLFGGLQRTYERRRSKKNVLAAIDNALNKKVTPGKDSPAAQ
jgi:hypothetical protein